MRLKWHFRKEPTENFCETPFKRKSDWKPQIGHPIMELFLSQLEKELFSELTIPHNSSNLSKEDWEAVWGLINDKSIVIKKANKGSCTVVWGREDYIKEAENHFKDYFSVYNHLDCKEDTLPKLVEVSNEMFRNLFNRKFISEKEVKYFTYEFKKATNLGKIYFLPKIHKRLSNVPGRPVISNCGTPTEKASEFLDYHLKPVMQEGLSYVKDSGDFMGKIKSLGRIPDGAFMVTADVVGLYPSIPHEGGLKVLKNRLNKRVEKVIPTEDLVSMFQKG